MNVPMAPTSAVFLLAMWIQDHGRDPCGRECTNGHGLPHRVTFQHLCGGLTRALVEAHHLLCATSGTLSAAAVRTTTCLRCGRVIVWQGAHIRQCDACRKTRAEEPAAVVHWAGPRPAWTPDEIEELVDWSTIDI